MNVAASVSGCCTGPVLLLFCWFTGTLDKTEPLFTLSEMCVPLFKPLVVAKASGGVARPS